MAILGLTDRAPEFPQIGILRKGAPKPERGPGRDLDYFRFDTDDKDAAKLFEHVYGAEPRSIRIYVPFSTTVENFEAWREEWSASSLQHRCDGQTCVRWLKDGKYSNEPVACPGNCKPTGRLKVIIPELRRLAYVTVLTTSIHDIIRIQANLRALESIRGDLRGIPLLLNRTPEAISTPDKDGKRARREKWLISIEAQPQWVDLQLAAQNHAAMGTGTPPPQLLLATSLAEADDDEHEEQIAGSSSNDSFPTRAAAPNAYRTGSSTVPQASAPSSESNSEKDENLRIRALLMNYCITLKKNEKAGKAYFEALYGKTTAAQRKEQAIKLNLISPAPAAEEIVEGEVLAESDPRPELIADIEELIVQLHKGLGRENSEITEQIARCADGEIGLEDMDVPTLTKVKGSLEFWRDTLKDELNRRAA